MKQNKSRFAVRLSWRIVIVTSLVFLLAIIIISSKGIRTTEKNSMDYSAQMLKTTIARLENHLKAVELAAQSIQIAAQAVDYVGEQFDTTDFFNCIASAIEGRPNIFGAGMFYLPYQYDSKLERAGIYVSRNTETGLTFNEWDDNATLAEDGWDYMTSEWFNLAKDRQSPVWTKPFYEYTNFNDYEFISAYVAPVYDTDGKMIAVCDVDLSLEWLQQALLKMRPYRESGIILMDANGDFICNPISDTPYEGNINEIPELSKIELLPDGPTDDWTMREDGVQTISFLHQRHAYFCVKSSLFNGWEMIIISKYKDAFAGLQQILNIILVISILGLGVLFFVCFRIIKTETKPLGAFAEAASKITDGHFNVPIPEVKRKDEIFELGTALSYMQTSVTNYIEELKVTTSEKERLAGELDIARKIQEHMLNCNFPVLEGCSMYAQCLPARQVGGDLYDFYVKEDTLYYIIADVSGKSVPAALLMSISISAFRAAIRNKHTMSEIVGIINNVFCRSNHDEMFITVNTGSINLKTGEMEICNAGHNPLVMIAPDGSASFLNLNSNLVCGVMPEFEYKNDHLTMEKGSRLVIYTDGVTEAENSDHSQYGEDRLLQFSAKHSVADVASDETVVRELGESIRSFVNGADQFDDITILSISRSSN